MPIQAINTGQTPNDGTGDPVRAAFTKANTNFSDLSVLVATAQAKADAAIAQSEKGAADGVAPLGSDRKVPATYLPSYVDGVLEFDSLDAMPKPGGAGQIYVARDTERIYRWSGSMYIEISPSPGSTDAVPEGSVNHYLTPARLAAITGNPSTGLGSGGTGATTAADARKNLQVYSSAEVDTALANRLPVFQGSAVPTTSQGPIYVAGVGVMEWNGARYDTNRLPPRYRSPDSVISASSARTIDAGAGAWRASSNDTDIVLSSTITGKTLQTTGAWQAGNNGNGLFSGVVAANTGYHVFVIKNPATGVVDIGFSVQVIPQVLPAGYTKYRRIGFFSTLADGTILAFFQIGRRFTFTSQIRQIVGRLDVDKAVALNGAPTGVACNAHLVLSLALNNDLGVSVRSPYQSGVSTANVPDVIGPSSGANTAHLQCLTDVNRQVIVGSYPGPVYDGVSLALIGYDDFLQD